MKIVSLNLRGLGGKEEFLSMKNFVLASKPSLVLIQETMKSTKCSIDYF